MYLLEGMMLIMVMGSCRCFSLWDETHYRACPVLDPVTHLHISELKGKWHASLTIVDTVAGGEDYEESDVCLSGELQPLSAEESSPPNSNSSSTTSNTTTTLLHQVWSLRSPSSDQHHPGEEPSAILHITSRLLRPGVWLLHTPLDGNVKATIYGYEKDKYMAVCGCGWRGGRLVHLWTVALSRDGTLTSLGRQVVGRVLEQGDLQSAGTKLIAWNTHC